MKAMLIENYGKTPLKMQDVAVPEITENDVLVEIYAASVNPVDFKIRDGKLKLILDYPLPLILGNDFAGKVVKIGENVTAFQVGDEVYGRVDKNRIGTFAEYVAINEKSLAKKPSNLDFVQAASLPLVALTAYQALFERMNLKQGDKLFIHAGAGGLGSIAIQLAKAKGIYVATTASGVGLELVEKLGADQIIDYRQHDFTQLLQNYDAVLDTLGGDALKKSFEIVKRCGIVISVSDMPTRQLAKEWNLGWFKQALFAFVSYPVVSLARQKGIRYEFLFMRPSGEQLDEITQLVEAGKVVPIIDKIFPFEQAQLALEYSETGRAKGKIIVQIKG